MSDSMSFDFSEATKLAGDLGTVAAKSGPFINSAVRVTATKVKKAAQESVKGGSKTWSGLPNTIDYEIKTGGSGSILSTVSGAVSNSITAEVGYNKARGGGKLGNIREFGAPAKSRGPHNDLANALEANQADFQKGLEIAAADGEKAAGL